MQKLKEEVIKFAQKLNSTNLSPLRSGNVSVRTTINNTEGFLITPSGIKYELLKDTDIVFLELNKEYISHKFFLLAATNENGRIEGFGLSVFILLPSPAARITILNPIKRF